MATQHVYLVLKGGYNAPKLSEEVWQCGIRWRLSNTDPSDVGDLPTDVDFNTALVSRDETSWTIEQNWQATGAWAASFDPGDWLNDQCAPALKTWFETSNIFPDTSELWSLTAYAMTNNRVHDLDVGPAKTVLTYKTAAIPNGAATTGSCPPQCSIVAGFGTALAGRKGKGRIYLPPPPASLLSVDGGFLSSSGQTNQANALKTAVAAMTLTAGVGTGPSVYPIVTGEPFTKYATVKAIRIGDVIDTQRRRRAQVTESYVSVAL